MIIRKYNNFDELYTKYNEEMIKNSDKYVLYDVARSYYLDVSLLNCKSNYFSFDLKKLKYTEMKIKMLYKQYIEEGSIEDLKKKLNKNHISCTFYFKNKKKRKGNVSDIDPCLLNIVFERVDRKSKFSRITIIYRATEISRKFGADLILINDILKQIEDFINIENINIFIVKPIITVPIVAAYLDNFNINIEDLKVENHLHRFILKSLEDAYSNKISSFQSFNELYKIIRGEK